MSNAYNMSVSAILINININVDSRFDYRTLARVTSLAIRAGGILEIAQRGADPWVHDA